MKKLIFALMILFAFACEDNRRSEREDELDENNTEVIEPDTTESDTATLWDQNRDVNSDRMDRDESGAESDTASTWDRHRDHNASDSDSIR